jgi:hypothetical protein
MLVIDARNLLQRRHFAFLSNLFYYSFLCAQFELDIASTQLFTNVFIFHVQLELIKETTAQEFCIKKNPPGPLQLSIF